MRDDDNNLISEPLIDANNCPNCGKSVENCRKLPEAARIEMEEILACHSPTIAIFFAAQYSGYCDLDVERLKKLVFKSTDPDMLVYWSELVPEIAVDTARVILSLDVDEEVKLRAFQKICRKHSKSFSKKLVGELLSGIVL